MPVYCKQLTMRFSWLGFVLERAKTARSPDFTFPDINKGATRGFMYFSKYLQPTWQYGNKQTIHNNNSSSSKGSTTRSSSSSSSNSGLIATTNSSSNSRTITINNSDGRNSSNSSSRTRSHEWARRLLSHSAPSVFIRRGSFKDERHGGIGHLKVNTFGCQASR